MKIYRFGVPLFLVVCAFVFSGCTSVPVYEQQFVSRPEMTFSDNPVENSSINMIGQIEPGSVVSGGGQAAGCTSCR